VIDFEFSGAIFWRRWCIHTRVTDSRCAHDDFRHYRGVSRNLDYFYRVGIGSRLQSNFERAGKNRRTLSAYAGAGPLRADLCQQPRDLAAMPPSRVWEVNPGRFSRMLSAYRELDVLIMILAFI
jgi:hypothetical protein